MIQILKGDCLSVLSTLPDQSVQCCVTSPPYWGLRDYGVEGQIGLEKTPAEYVAKLVAVFAEVNRVLRDDGTLWLNLGDSYNAAGREGRGTRIGFKQGTNRASANGHDNNRPSVPSLKPKDLVGIPWMVAFALRADGWYLRSDIIWHKPNPMPESVTDRPTKAHEYIFLMSKNAKYFYDADAIKEPSVSDHDSGNSFAGRQGGAPHLPMSGGEGSKKEWKCSPKGNGKWETQEPQSSGKRIVDRCAEARANGADHEHPFGQTRNKRSVWTVTTQCYSEAHFATFPEDLIKPCIMAGTSAKGCCAKCGAPWERIIEHPGNPKGILGYRGVPNAQTKGGGFDEQHVNAPNGTRLKPGHNPTQFSKAVSLGWQPTCGCGELNTQPCTVLDPFGGSGTTGQVAIELARKAILIELNPEYCKLIADRTNVTPGLAL